MARLRTDLLDKRPLAMLLETSKRLICQTLVSGQPLTTGAVSGRLKRRLAWAISSSTRSCCRAGTVRSRGFCPWPVVKPSFQVFSLSSKATNKVPAVVLSGTWQVAGVVIGFLLHSDCSRVMEKKLTNSVPLREPADKHSIYPRGKITRFHSMRYQAGTWSRSRRVV